jgi:pilus assembly protein Flp/PilA
MRDLHARIRRHLRRLAEGREGATAIEYGLILALIVIGLIAAMSTVGSRAGDTWGGMAKKVAAATPST